ncbi:hypothetical protein [Amycolatopsis magusensis]|uniref:hypothetical protein n=1 Tax=Amycolatopsis magusensis TaxID=882444 RepID=UPI0037B379A9
MRQAIVTFWKDFAYGIHAGNAIRHGLPVPARRGDPVHAAYLDGRDVRWQAVFDREIAAAGTDGRRRLLALFETLRVCTEDPALTGCTFARIPPTGPFSHQVIQRHEDTLSDRMTELAAEAGAPDPAALAGRLLLVFRTAALLHETGARPTAVAEAATTAAGLIDSHLTVPAGTTGCRATART